MKAIKVKDHRFAPPNIIAWHPGNNKGGCNIYTVGGGEWLFYDITVEQFEELYNEAVRDD